MWSTRFPTSVYQCQAWRNTTVSCDPLEFGTFEPNADIAGPGVVLSFEIALCLTIIMVIVALSVQAAEYLGAAAPREEFDCDGNPINLKDSWRVLLDGLLIGLSDTQAITGLALLVVTLFNAGCGLSVYHYDLICDLILMSLIVHFCSMTVISHYFNVWWLGTVRSVLLMGNFCLGFELLFYRSYKNFPVTTPSFDGLPLEPTSNGTVNGTAIPGSSLVLPAVCFMDNSTMTIPIDKSSASIVGFVEYALLFVFFLIAVVLSIRHTHFMKPRSTMDYEAQNNQSQFKRTTWTYWVRGLMSLAGFGGSIAIMVHVTHFQKWMQESGWFDGEDEFDYNTFGQLLPLIMLALPVLGFLEAIAASFFDKSPTKSELKG